MAEAESDDSNRLRNRWLAAFAVSLCYGFSAYFVTGDTGTALSLFLLVMAIFAALLLVVPRRLIVEKPLSEYRKAGLAVLIGPFLILALGLRTTPWNDLEQGYRTDAPAPVAGVDAGDEVVLLQPVDEFMVRPHSFKRATTSFTDAGVYLAPPWPLSLIYDPVWIPAGAIRTCRQSQQDTMYASLAVRGVAARVEVLDPSEQVLAWCRRRGIDDGLEKPMGLLD